MTSRPTRTCPVCAYQITFISTAHCPRCRFRLIWGDDPDKVASHRAHFQVAEQAKSAKRAGPRAIPDRKAARDWYLWLWFSPLLTLPTAVAVSSFFDDLAYELACMEAESRYARSYRCDWALYGMILLLPAFVLSALWHLLLLIPARDKRPFVRWHGRQALCLAGLRTLVPVLITLVRPEEASDGAILLAAPILLLIWFVGGWWGRWQAKVGRCSLMRWTGHEQELLHEQQRQASRPGRTTDIDSLIRTIRFGKGPESREYALDQLISLGLVEYL